MKTSIRIILFLLAFGALVCSVTMVKAQCAMCSTAVETNAKSGSDATKGLNKGILFLLAAPYFAVGVVGYIWYKKYRRKNVSLNMRGEKLHLN